VTRQPSFLASTESSNAGSFYNCMSHQGTRVFLLHQAFLAEAQWHLAQEAQAVDDSLGQWSDRCFFL
jgi:hypothetical protein